MQGSTLACALVHHPCFNKSLSRSIGRDKNYQTCFLVLVEALQCNVSNFVTAITLSISSKMVAFGLVTFSTFSTVFAAAVYRLMTIFSTGASSPFLLCKWFSGIVDIESFTLCVFLCVSSLDVSFPLLF
jgi:hypothetical protein